MSQRHDLKVVATIAVDEKEGEVPERNATDPTASPPYSLPE